jgi:hypothetical protein
MRNSIVCWLATDIEPRDGHVHRREPGAFDAVVAMVAQRAGAGWTNAAGLQIVQQGLFNRRVVAHLIDAWPLEPDAAISRPVVTVSQLPNAH